MFAWQNVADWAILQLSKIHFKIFTTYLLKKYHLFVYVQEGNIKSNSKQTLDKYGGLNAG